uniref:Chloroplast polyphenol oxidase n=1 Tax=Hymenophyllum caudiculatum TaxID=295381 RepID=A0A2P1JJ69_9MONI|nr:chloroplast polyphenol oxidase [Hymenophyllum caudiculatum]
MESSTLRFSGSSYGGLQSSSQPFLSSSPQWKQLLLLPTPRLSPYQLRCRSAPPSSSPLPGHALASSSSSASPPPPDHLSHLDRRHLLLASTLGFAGLPLLDPAALAAPVTPPDLRQCSTPIDPGNGAASVDCCLPVATASTYTLPANLPLRVRRPAHLVSSEYKAKYIKAYKLLRELPDDDPRQYTQQVKLHCALCDAAYDENGTSIEYQVHNSWLFFPWHRWYLYFHERILGSLINDDTFRLPFWNWDDAAGNTLPPLYINSQSSLYDSNRNPAHQPPTVVDLNYNFTESTLSAAAQQKANNTLMYRQMVTNSKTPSLFFGETLRQGDAASPGAGTIENVPHGTVHVWTGNPSNPNDEDMGALYSASRDPIFYAHHSNIDRLWEVWKGLGGRRKDITDSDWLNTTFDFFDEKSQLVRVKIGDALDTTKLGYKYEEVTNPWLTATPSRRSRATATTSFGPAGVPATAMAGLSEKIKKGLQEFKQRKSKKLDGVVSALVNRSKKVKAADFEEEILVLKGVEIASDENVKFDVYINLSDTEGKEGCDISEYAGSFFNVPHLGMKMGDAKRVRKSNFKLGIGDVLNELGIEDDDSFSVTIVPRSTNKVGISIQDVLLEYE